MVVCSPTDQGYFEPDTSALIRLKLASEYGYGINPSTTLTDKVNLLGSGAHPFWRWLEGTCRTPAGLGRVEVRRVDLVVLFRLGLVVHPSHSFSGKNKTNRQTLKSSCWTDEPACRCVGIPESSRLLT